MIQKNINAAFVFKFICLLLILFTDTSLNSQTIQNNFDHFTEMDGLPSNQTHMMIQDHLGYIWIGTSNGLSRYDGYEFLNFNPVPDDTNFLQVSVIHSLYEDGNGDIWIGAIGGLTKYDRAKEKFKLYNYSEFERENGNTFTVTSISGTSDGDIIFGVWDVYTGRVDNGLFMVDKKTDQISLVNLENDDPVREILSIKDLGEDKFLVSGYNGFGEYDYSKKRIKWYPFNEQHWIASFLRDGNSFWMGSGNQGLIKYNLKDSSYTTFPIFNDFNESNRWSIIWDIIIDKNGQLLMSTSRGLATFNHETNSAYFARSDPLNPSALHSEELNRLLQDNSGNIWISSHSAGISKFNSAKNNFRSYKHTVNNRESISPGWVHLIFENSPDEIWFQSADNIISKFDKIKKTFNNVEYPPGLRVSDILKDSKNQIWFAGGGLYKLDLNKWRFENVDIPLNDQQSFITVLHEDSRGTMWIGTPNGLVTYDRDNNLTANVDFRSLGIGTAKSNTIHRLIEDHNRILWIGTDDGLFKYELNSRQYTRVGNSSESSKSLNSQDVNSLYSDSKGKIWIGSWMGGLNCYDPANGNIKSFGKKEGLKSHSVQGILGDEENGALWLSTFNGISRFDLDKETFQNFDIEDGVQGNQFADGAALRTSDGYLIFGGQNGITMFKPGEIKSDLVPPKVVITDFKIFNESVKHMVNSPLESSIFKTDKIKLNYDENDISIDYFAAHYVNPKRNKYAYRLVNYEADWRFVGNKRSAIYPNLPPGEYIFEVKAANNNDIWSEEEVSLEIVINAPPWKTWWAYSSYMIIFLAFLYSVRRIEITRQNKNAEIKESQLRAEAAEAQAMVIKAENDRKTKELEEARQLQLSMLPKELPQLPNLDIAVYMKTATEVGGDYYDFHVSMDGTLTVVIGDATGHGMRAGTMVTAVKGLFNSYAPNPDILFSFHEMTRCIKQMHLEKLSMCMTMLKIQENRMLMSTAGMPPIFINRKEDQVTEEIMLKGMPLGTMEKFPYDVRETVLNPGDTILLMSDGFPELQNNKSEQLGYKRARNLFEENVGHSPEEIVTKLKDEGSRWVNDKDPDDDVTFVVIKVK